MYCSHRKELQLSSIVESHYNPLPFFHNIFVDNPHNRIPGKGREEGGKTHNTYVDTKLSDIYNITPLNSQGGNSTVERRR